MSDQLGGLRGPSEDSEDGEDIFKATFASSSNTGKVKISGGGVDQHVGLATAKLQKGMGKYSNEY